MADQTSAEELQVGDLLAADMRSPFNDGYLRFARITRITPSGRFVVTGGVTLNPDLTERGGSARFRRATTNDLRTEHLRRRRIVIENADFGKVSASSVDAIFDLLRQEGVAQSVNLPALKA